MNEKQVLELMRDVAYFASHRTGTPLANLLDEIGSRLAALPAAAQADGEEPTSAECEAAFREACDDPESVRELRRGIAAVRSLMLRARPAPSRSASVAERCDATLENIEALADLAVKSGAPVGEVQRLANAAYCAATEWNVASGNAARAKPSPSPAPSQALVEAADAMWEWGHVVLDRAGDVGNAKVPFTVALDRYDLARSSLPAAKKEGGA